MQPGRALQICTSSSWYIWVDLNTLLNDYEVIASAHDIFLRTRGRLGQWCSSKLYEYQQIITLSRQKLSSIHSLKLKWWLKYTYERIVNEEQCEDARENTPKRNKRRHMTRSLVTAIEP